jgi:hypothetical protein
VVRNNYRRIKSGSAGFFPSPLKSHQYHRYPASLNHLI